MQYSSKKLAMDIANILKNKKAVDVVVLDISHLTVITDYFIIASGRSETQVKALYNEVEEKMAEKGLVPKHKDGYQGGRWVVLDYGDAIAHIFHHEERGFYSLERLWADGIHLAIDK